MPPGEGAEIDNVEIAVVDGKSVFLVDIHKPPEPVASSGSEWTWPHACMLLDPETLQCRVHDTEFYPSERAEYPGHSPVLKQETECGRVERHHDDERLLDDAALGDLHGLLLGPHTLGAKLFVHPEPGWLAGTVNHLKRHKLASGDCAKFINAAVGPHPGSTGVGGDRASRACAKMLESESRADEAIAAWDAVASRLGNTADNTPDPDEVEVARGVPETPGQDTVRDDD